MKTIIGQQGEVLIIKIGALPEGMKTKPVEKTAAGFILSHSESGNHHCLTGGDVMERVDNVPAGMRILYALLEKPEKVIQDGASPHKSYTLDAGVYKFPISREYDPFSEQARIVAD